MFSLVNYFANTEVFLCLYHTKHSESEAFPFCILDDLINASKLGSSGQRKKFISSLFSVFSSDI
jgi:hypothetical protein